MPTCIVNLAHIDPPANGGVSRLAREVSLAILDTPLNVIFVVRARFLPKFRDWLGSPKGQVIPYIARVGIKPLLSWVKPHLIVSPLFGTEPFVQTGDIPHIVSLPDTLALDLPDMFSGPTIAERYVTYQRVRSVTRIVTLSEFSRSRLVHHLNILPEQVKVIGLGANMAPESPVQTSVPKPYLLYPANPWPHKRHDLLFEIMALLWQQQPELHLVLTGGRPKGVDVQGLIARYAPPGRVWDLGYVSDKKLGALYRDAAAMLFVSRYEGFGMPLLEAMWARCPVICAPLTAIPEIAGDSALYVDSDVPAAWADALLHQLPEQRETLTEKAYQRVQAFTWERTRQQWSELVMSLM